eukprot:scaffold85663_cov45-Attheya_sp.AAC.6
MPARSEAGHNNNDNNTNITGRLLLVAPVIMMAARGIVRTAHRSVLSSRALSSSRWSTATSLDLDSNSKDNNGYNATSKRWFGLYRHE